MKTMTKSILPLLFLIVLNSNSIFSQDSIPNHNFETWITYYNPLDWQTTNLLLPTGTLNCFQTDNSYEGDYAMQLKTIDVFGLAVPGVATIGTLDMNTTSGGIPFIERPLMLNGFYQHKSSGDEVMVAVELFKNGAIIGSGVWSTTDSIPQFEEFSIPISYSSGIDPDTMNITILTDPYQIGSGLIIDALSFEYETTGWVHSKENEAHLNCYPNPATNNITIETSNEKEIEVSLYSLDGKLMKGAKINSCETKMSLKDLQPGIYFIVSFDGKDKHVRKIEKL